MAYCVSVDGTGAVVATGGSLADCTGYVLLTPDEFQQSQGLFAPLSASEGASIGGAIFLAWAIAFGFRAIGKVITETDEGGT